jgi:hypothetical protein
MPIVMRCWWPETIRALLTGHGFRITDEWGGYHGERFGDGTELVIGFTV